MLTEALLFLQEKWIADYKWFNVNKRLYDLSLLIRCINITANQQYKSTLPIFHWQQCYNIKQKLSMHFEITWVIPYFFAIHISHLLISKA